ncbi:pickpocket protein 28-like [Anopheles aquasalis]|uniref:pickpocket protein 28-like n=1 Tax=Anopheles aquasalis TaxID=42839 RepID=UPI00215A881B|nr:pickpocket protein 28-like [Anopheles aquasalis]
MEASGERRLYSWLRWRTWKSFFRDYFAASSCHGMRYIVEPGLSLPERTSWSLMVTVSLCCCISGIIYTHLRWQEKPLIVSFSSSSIKAWQVPFPAITICPQTRIASDVFNVTEVYLRQRHNRSLVTETEWHQLRALAHVCSTVMRPKDDYYGSTAEDRPSSGPGHQGEQHSGHHHRQQQPLREPVVPLLVNMSIPQAELFETCMWSFNFRPCRTLWARKVTENGICYSFNMLSHDELFSADQAFRERDLNPDEHLYPFKTLRASQLRSTGWTMENGYTAEEDLLSYPRRTASAGFKGGTIALLMTDVDDREYVCSGAQQGYRVTIHPPDEFPRLTEYHIRVPPMQAVSIIVKPRLLTSQKSLRQYPVAKRQCYFAGERNLRFFRVYNEQNCEFECLTNFTLRTCGCVTFAMPRTNTTPVCGAEDVRCYRNAATNMMELGATMMATESIEICECLPACTTIKYDVEISNDMLNLERMLASMIHKDPDREYLEPMLLYVYFKDNKFLYRKRVAYTTFNGELASFGGILALLAGMSLTSLAELVYFMVVRPLCHWLRSQYGPTRRSSAASSHEIQLPHVS